LFEGLINAFKIRELRRKILYTFGLLVVYRLGSFIPVPGINTEGLAGLFGLGGLFDFLDMFAGGAFSNMTIFALNVSPYITASIVMNLLATVIPYLEQLAKEGEEGRRKLAQYTRYATVLLALIQGIGITYWLRALITGEGLFPLIQILATLVAGSMFVMWLGEQITDIGIGNGISLIIFAGIVSRLPVSVMQMIRSFGEGGISLWNLILYVILSLAVITGIVLITEGQRRIPVQYAKRIIGRKMYGGQSTHIPIRVNQAGVIPVIFASSVMAFPITLINFFPALQPIAKWFRMDGILYMVLYTVLIIVFTYFYTGLTFDPVDVADNMKKHGGFIPGLRPGDPTARHLDKILSRITFVGAIFLAVIAVLPTILSRITGIPDLGFTGVGLLIVVGVALETMKQIEAQLIMRQYEGFMK
jgi:preprotein translocase subunit SecY